MTGLPDAKNFVGKRLANGRQIFEVQFNGLEFFQTRKDSARLRTGYVINIPRIQFHLHIRFVELKRLIGITMEQIGERLC